MSFRGAITGLLAVAAVACGSTAAPGFANGGDDGGSGNSDASNFGGGSDGGGGQFSGDAGPTFGTTCNGAASSITGTVYAPNGMDPLPNIYVYAAATVNPFPHGNYCNQCNKPLDVWYSHTQSGPGYGYYRDQRSAR